ncbi:energy transducer TonB [Desulfurobacterium sp.]
MSTYSLSRNKILFITITISLILHLAILKIISANSYSTGEKFSLSRGNGKIKVSLKTYTRNTVKRKEKVKKNNKTEKTIVVKPKIKIFKKHNKKKVQGNEVTIKNKKNSNREKHINTKKFGKSAENREISEKKNPKPQIIKSEITNKTEKNTGGNIFSFLNWEQRYIDTVISRLENQKEYPMVAREMGIQGTVKLILTIGRNGNLLKVTIARTSGFPILDKNAVETAKKAKFPPFPHKVKKDKIEIPVYVIYKLTEIKKNM